MSNNRIYFPNSEQFKRINGHLKTIANTLGYETDVSTWEGIQKAVRSGVAREMFPVGSQFNIYHSVYEGQTYEVVAHDYFKSNHDENAHTMTLMCRDVYPAMQFDSREAFYYADSPLEPGTYHFSIPEIYGAWAKVSYQFTLTQRLPQGGQLCLQDNAESPMTSQFVTVFSSRTSTTPIETVRVSMGNAGTNLGTFGVELNHTHRIAYGSDNYKESAIRQFLNSSGNAGSVWNPQTKYDRPPSWVNSTEGFLKGLDPRFLSTIGSVIVPCSANNVFESPDSTVTKGEKYTVVDKFYLASQMEVYGTSVGSVVDGSTLLSYYKDATNVERIKCRDDVPAGCRLRTPVDAIGNNVRLIHTDGSLKNDFAYLNYGYAPMCTIV